MTTFVHSTRASRVVFGPGSLGRLADEADQLGLRRILLIAGPRYRDTARTLLGNRVAATIDRVRPHVPRADAEEAQRIAADVGADGCVSVGGGAAVGLAKAVALVRPVRILAVPTTYAGSELTPVWGLTDEQGKTTGRNEAVAPGTVVYDPLLTSGLTTSIAHPSGLNAMAHAVEALYAPDGTPVLSLLAEEGIRLLAASLPALRDDEPDATADARADALRGAWLCGVCLGSSTMSLHHKLAHVLGGTFGLPHAETHSVLLPRVLSWNAQAAPEAARIVARALGATSPADAGPALLALSKSLRIPASLKDLGFGAEDIEVAVSEALRSPYANPRPVDAEGIRAILSAAVEGRLPTG